jgi:hypothetical protein
MRDPGPRSLSAALFGEKSALKARKKDGAAFDYLRFLSRNHVFQLFYRV